MKKIAITFVFILLYIKLFSQVTTYSFTQSSGTYVTITGGTVIASGLADDSLYTSLPLGFNFNYNGVNYNTFGLNINGWIALGSTTPVNTYLPVSDVANNNVISALGKDLQMGFVSNGSYTSGSNVVTNMGSTAGYAVGDVLLTHAGFPTGTTITAVNSTSITLSSSATATGVSTYAVKGVFRYGILGTAPNRICVLQWSKARRYGTSITEGRNDLFNFQIQLHETTNEIKFSYGTFQTNTTSSNYQIGIKGGTTNDFNNRKTTTNWASTAAGTVNADVCSLSTTVKPASGQTYTFTPPTSCTGTPVAGTVSAPTSVCSGETFDLTLTGYSPTNPWLNFQWQQATSLNGTYTNINGATTATYSTSQTSTTYYKCVVTCGGSSATSTAVAIALNTNPTSCYCIPNASDCTWDDLINSVNFVSIDTFTGCSPSDGYHFYQSPVPDLYRGQTYPITVSIGSEAAIDQATLWIDYNQNGVFESTEFSVLGTGNDYITSSVSVPLGAVLGNTRMRIRARSVDAIADPGNVPLTGTDACTAFLTGETEDYVVNIMDNSVGIEDVDYTGFFIYPNPASNYINIAVSEAYSYFNINMLNTQGQRVFYSENRNTTSGSVKSIDVEQLAKGVYFLQIHTSNNSKTQKIIID